MSNSSSKMLSRTGAFRRRNCRSLCTSISSTELLVRELGTGFNQNGIELTRQRSLQGSVRHTRSQQEHRQHSLGIFQEAETRDEPTSNSHVPLHLLRHAKVSSAFRACSKVASQPIATVAPSNDACQRAEISTNITSGILPHKTSSESPNLQTLGDFLTQVKHPAQVEWEQLWYHGISAAHKKIAHHFPNLDLTSSGAAVEESISEPTLNISSLGEEEQELFKQEERLSRGAFSPKSEKERLHRQLRAQNATDERQKIALLLGLPTFDEYIAHKSLQDKQVVEKSDQPSKRQLKRETRFALKKEKKQSVKVQQGTAGNATECGSEKTVAKTSIFDTHWNVCTRSGMTHPKPQATTSTSLPIGGAEHRPLVVGLTKPQSTRSASTMATSSEAAALNKEIETNIQSNVNEAAPSQDNPTAPTASKPKKEKAPKQPKPQKAAAPVAPTSPALIDLRVGHILRAMAHPNADSLYVSTIAMGDPEGTEHTQIDEETGKVVRTVCSGLNGLVPLEEMQDRKIVVVANLKPVNMRSIKSAAMVLAASPKQAEGADPHAPDRVVELVQPPEAAEAGDKVYFEGWPYGDGKGPEKQLNPKKKQWEAIQPGFYTSDELVVGFDAGQCDEVDGTEKGNLVVEGKGFCTVKTLKGAIVR